jgi:hypothetical protein
MQKNMYKFFGFLRFFWKLKNGYVFYTEEVV